jgi:predicted secreted protein
MLIPAIISLTERALLLPLWWTFAFRVLRCGCNNAGGWRLGEEYLDRNWLRGKRITLRTRRVLTAILMLIFGLMLMGKLVRIAKS